MLFMLIYYESYFYLKACYEYELRLLHETFLDNALFYEHC